MLNLVFGTVPPSRATCDQPTCRAVRFAPANKESVTIKVLVANQVFIANHAFVRKIIDNTLAQANQVFV